ncbi:MAG: HAMP domain-containing sensor histidine kinase [Myxococcota bacterium]
MAEADQDIERMAEATFALLEASAEDLASEFLRRLEQRLPEHPRDILPTETLLNHIPAVLQHVAEAVRGDETAPLRVALVKTDLEEFSRLRRGQGYGLEEVTEELGMLEDIVLHHIEEATGAALTEFSARSALVVTGRLRRAFEAMKQYASRAYLHEATSDSLERIEILSDFGRAVTHELRNRVNGATLALSAFKAVSEGDRGRTADPASERILERLQGTLDRIARVVDDVFAVAVARSREDPLHEARQSLDRVVREAVEDMESTAEHAGVSLRIASDLPSVPVDPVHARLILINLISNGIKYHREQDDEEASPYVELRVEREGRRSWRVFVEDNGIGIAAEHHEQIFRRYVRGEHESTEGQGIGLNIARRAATKLGGDIGVRSEVGRGSTFFFTVRQPERGGRRSLPPPSGPIDGGTGADDEPQPGPDPSE